jgi:Holliday junction resolvase
MLEKVIQQQILTGLRSAGWKAWKNQQGRFGTNGIPDLTAMKDGTVVYLEVKRPGEKATKLQAITIRDIQAHGVPAGIVSSLEETWELIRNVRTSQRAVS